MAMTFNEMRELKKGWDGYYAGPPNDIAIDNAKYVVECLKEKGLEIEYIVPSVEDGVGVSIKCTGDIYIGIECYNDGEFTKCISDALGIDVIELKDRSGIKLWVQDILDYFGPWL